MRIFLPFWFVIAVLINIIASIFYRIEGNDMFGNGRISSRSPKLCDFLEYHIVGACERFCTYEHPWIQEPW